MRWTSGVQKRRQWRTRSIELRSDRRSESVRRPSKKSVRRHSIYITGSETMEWVRALEKQEICHKRMKNTKFDVQKRYKVLEEKQKWSKTEQILCQGFRNYRLLNERRLKKTGNKEQKVSGSEAVELGCCISKKSERRHGRARYNRFKKQLSEWMKVLDDQDKWYKAMKNTK